MRFAVGPEGGGGETVRLFEVELVCGEGDESVVVSVTVSDPVDEYTCVVVVPVPVDPSPKFQLTLYGEVPPEGMEANVTMELIDGLAGAKVKLVERGEGGITHVPFCIM